LSRSGVFSISGFSPGVEDERRHGVDQLHLEQLHGGHFGEQQPPRVAAAEIHLLQILIEAALGKEILLRRELLRQQRHLGQARRFGEPRHRG
jgi:hypothetical protein